MRFSPRQTSVLLLSALGCAAERPPQTEALIVPDACDGRDEGIVCQDGVALTCLEGDVLSRDDCRAEELKCNSMRGCEACVPNAFECDGNSLMRCAADGRSRRFEMACPEDTLCSSGGCADLCAEAEESRSYIGCDYWPVFTLNSMLDPVFRPAVVVGNPQLVPIHIKLTRGRALIAEADVMPGTTHTIDIPAPENEPLRVTQSSLLARQAAYHLVSNGPVTVHQFNPLLFEVDRECERRKSINPCPAQTNDASLLLPSHVLAQKDGTGVSYLGISRASFIAEEKDRRSGVSGFLALAAVGERPVQVRIRSSAYTQAAVEADEHGAFVLQQPVELGDAGFEDAGSLKDAGLDMGPPPEPTLATAFPALRPGDSEVITLEPGDVFQLLTQIPEDCPFEERMSDKPGETVCDPGSLYDLTGTSVEADGPLQLIGGHDCSYVPFDRVACDHLEETLFPVETWGRSVIVGSPTEQSVARAYRLRVVSAADNNRVSFEPALHAPVTLARGEWFELETDQDVLVSGTRALSVAQYLLGQGRWGRDGDPSMTLVPPIEQYRNQYNFLSPASYSNTFVMVVVPAHEDVILDGDTLAGFSPIGQTGYKIVTKLLKEAGDHEIHSVSGGQVGITLYGVAPYTSYMLPGGLDLRLIPDIL